MNKTILLTAFLSFILFSCGSQESPVSKYQSVDALVADHVAISSNNQPPCWIKGDGSGNGDDGMCAFTCIHYLDDIDSVQNCIDICETYPECPRALKSPRKSPTRITPSKRNQDSTKGL